MAPGCVTVQNNAQITPRENTKQSFDTNVTETSSNNTNTDNNSNNSEANFFDTNINSSLFVSYDDEINLDQIPLPPTPPPENQITFGESNENSNQVISNLTQNKAVNTSDNKSSHKKFKFELLDTVDTFEILEQTIIKQKKLAKLKNTDLRKKILLKRTFDLVCEIMDYENGFDDDDDDDECENENEKKTEKEINTVEKACSNDEIESKISSSPEKQDINIFLNSAHQLNDDKTKQDEIESKANNDENNKLTLVKLDNMFYNNQLNQNSAKVPVKRRRSTSDDDDDEQDDYDNYEDQLNENSYEINDFDGSYFYNFNSNYNSDQQLSCLNNIIANLHDSDLNLYLTNDNTVTQNFNKNKPKKLSKSGSNKSKKFKTISI